MHYRQFAERSFAPPAKVMMLQFLRIPYRGKTMGAPPPNPRCVPFKVLVKSSLPVQSLNLNLAPNPSPRLNLQLTLPVLRKKCSPPRDANRCLCRPCPTATSGTVPAAEKPCGSSNASPRHNSIWHPSIPHDRLRQSGRPACSTHAFTEVCPYHPATLQNLLHRRPETTR